MFENPRRGTQARNFTTTQFSENSRSQIVFRTDIFQNLKLGAPDMIFIIGPDIIINLPKGRGREKVRDRDRSNFFRELLYNQYKHFSIRN